MTCQILLGSRDCAQKPSHTEAGVGTGEQLKLRFVCSPQRLFEEVNGFLAPH